MYVILTSRPGQFRTEPGEGLRPIEAYDYMFGGTRRAQFVIAELTWETRVRVIDEAPPPVVSLVPSKFLERFDSLEGARHELEQLTNFRSVRAALERAPLPAVP